MLKTEFIQYLPNNLRKRVLIPLPDAVAAQAKEIKKRGFRLECKNLGDGSVMIAVADGDMDFLLASRTVENGPGVPSAVEGLIADVHAVLKERDERKVKAPALIN